MSFSSITIELTKAQPLPIPPAPQISIVSPTLNSNYSKVISLVFTVQTNGTFDLPPNLSVSEKGLWGIDAFSYCLDGHSNVTISGNVTLNDLLNGKHQVVVYAVRWIYYGIYFGGVEDSIASEPLSFYVSTETPTPSANPTVPEFPSLTTLLMITTMVTAGLLVYFKKRKAKSV
jgi:hypothetical protein